MIIGQRTSPGGRATPPRGSVPPRTRAGLAGCCGRRTIRGKAERQQGLAGSSHSPRRVHVQTRTQQRPHGGVRRPHAATGRFTRSWRPAANRNGDWLILQPPEAELLAGGGRRGESWKLPTPRRGCAVGAVVARSLRALACRHGAAADTREVGSRPASWSAGQLSRTPHTPSTPPRPSIRARLKEDEAFAARARVGGAPRETDG